jgi:hypothetical protein
MCCLFAFGGVSNSDDFSRNHNFAHSTFYRPLKIAKIIIGILYIHENVSAILFGAIVMCGFGCMIISFQNCIISFYIEILHQFWPFTYLHYKTAVSW